MNDENNNLITNEAPGAPDDDLYIFEDTTPAGTPMGPAKRIISIFTAPGKLVENIIEFPRFLTAVIAILIISFASAVATMLVLPIVTNVQSIAIAERYGVDFLNLMQATDILMENSFAFAFILSWIGVAFAAFAGVMWGAVVIKILSLIMKGSATFKQYLSLLLHINVISLLGGSVVASLLMLATDSAMVFTSLAPIFMPNGDYLDPMFNMLSTIELFGIWSMIVLAIGIKKFNPGFSTGKAVTATAIYYLLSVGLTTAMTAFAVLYYDLMYNNMTMLQQLQ